MPETAHKRELTSTVYATPLMTPTTALGLSIRLSMFELRETGDWDIFLGPPGWARAETGGADQWVLKRRECSGFARVNKVTSASPEYPLSVFNKNSTLKVTLAHTKIFFWTGDVFFILPKKRHFLAPPVHKNLQREEMWRFDWDWDIFFSSCLWFVTYLGSVKREGHFG